MIEKVCTKCEENKRLDEFHKGNGKLERQSRCIACQKKWCKENKKHLEEYKRQYHIKNKQKHNKSSHGWYWNGRIPFVGMTAEDKRKYKKQWYEENKERCIAKAKVGKSKRRMRIYKNGGSFTEKEWLDLCKKVGGKCVCCGVFEHLSVDHISPISKGGRNDIQNIQPLCLPCNLKKGAKTINYLI